MRIISAPESVLAPLEGFSHPSRHVEVEPGVRMAYVDVGPTDAPTVLLAHGQPTWSYLYRHVIDRLAAGGARVIAPDNIGFGRSDKPVDPTDYTVERHIGWLRALVTGLELCEITLVCQDWGGPLGLSVLAAEPDRFAGVVATNTILHTASPDLAGRLDWAFHADGSRVVLEQALVDYLLYCVRAPELQPSMFVGAATARDLTAADLAGYDLPFPDAAHTGGLRSMTALLPLTPNDPGARIGRATMRALAEFEKPFLTCFGDSDPATRGWETVFREHVPGAAGLPHRTLEGAGHFVQEDAPDALAEAILGLL